MASTAPIVLLYVFVLLIDYLPKKKERAVKERVIYIVLLSLSFCVLVLYTLDIPVPGPSKPIKSAVEKLLVIAESLF